MKKIYKNFIFDIVMAVLALALFIVMLPPIGIGQNALNILLALTLVAYLVVYLFDKVRRCRGTLFVLAAIEFVVICIISLGLILQQFKVFNISGVCSTIGIVLWLRGVVSVLGMYLTASAAKKTKYSLPAFLLYLLLVSFGMYIYANPIITDLAINWIICIFFFVCALAFAGLAILYAPARKRKSEKVADGDEGKK